MATTRTTDGMIPFTVGDETFHTWYKVFGDLKNSTRTPLVVLHGGPGLTHDYLIPLSDLTRIASIPIVLYDQIGNGRSTHLRSKSKSFWTIDLFISELENLVSGLGIAERFDILGHSWGGSLAAEFAIRRQHPGLRMLVLSNALASRSLRIKAERQLHALLPREHRDAIAAGPEADKEKYEAALEYYGSLHLCTVQPMPTELVYSLAQIKPETGDPTVVTNVFGGEYNDEWTVIDRLDRILVPTFVVNGRADPMQDSVCKPLFDGIRKAKWLTFEGSSHSPFWEERERYMEIIIDFLSL
ncbi:uncharacterized protein FIBRA_01845 [Fibroporia radiculosa]|uniref:AB hydrolase-1 domain-containing protein n=1 Tax=Fibroporia radiculosa TaxID=599839 RepID=J4I8Q5_9APHY|nr:uncharacterized protein FIBRA_01845 [Fibroporia radiculosa]CCL99821.1 predicted protein [Fibroporia radiculosa]